MINTVIVDDEPLALDILEAHIQRHEDLRLIGRCNNAKEALTVLNTLEVDLLILDINMPEINGIQLIKKLELPPIIVFATAHQKHALDGFDMNITDFLLKPISYDRFSLMVDRVKKSIGEKEIVHEPNNESEIAPDYFFIKVDKRFQKMFFDDLIYIEGLKDYVIFKTTKGRIVTLYTLKYLEEKLPQNIFVRTHRSYIVNLQKIRSIDNGQVEVMVGQATSQLPIGKLYKDNLNDFLIKYKL